MHEFHMLGGVQYCDPLATQSKFSHPPHKSEQAEQTVKYSHLRKIIQFRYIIHVASYETGIQVTFAELQIIFLESTNIRVTILVEQSIQKGCISHVPKVYFYFSAKWLVFIVLDIMAEHHRQTLVVHAKTVNTTGQPRKTLELRNSTLKLTVWGLE